ncbi:MAG TPA: DUF2250 domain-containing protein [candidate division Zixibacteria bacterium]|nr:DUF2250 domain-containing protein [candidate division Zixibacteria bacterium]HEQ99401.1 DUF2250 domain-containing protein [candidate division Zixibacteria bacterium]
MAKKGIYLAEGYKLAKCCNPEPGSQICGYYSYNNEMVVHKKGCKNLAKVEKERLVDLKWKEILAAAPEMPEGDFANLTELDFEVLKHHRDYGNDYSLKVARMLHKPKQDIFDSHAKLREMNLLERVKPLIIQYRKGVVDNKWIKHRNHTYYDLTEKGKLYLSHYLHE